MKSGTGELAIVDALKAAQAAGEWGTVRELSAILMGQTRTPLTAANGAIIQESLVETHLREKQKALIAHPRDIPLTAVLVRDVRGGAIPTQPGAMSIAGIETHWRGQWTEDVHNGCGVAYLGPNVDSVQRLGRFEHCPEKLRQFYEHHRAERIGDLESNRSVKHEQLIAFDKDLVNNPQVKESLRRHGHLAWWWLLQPAVTGGGSLRRLVKAGRLELLWVCPPDDIRLQPADPVGMPAPETWWDLEPLDPEKALPRRASAEAAQ